MRINLCEGERRAKDEGKAQQIIGREGETATFIWRCLFTLCLRVIGFAPRQFNRSMLAIATSQTLAKNGKWKILKNTFLNTYFY